jgi:hypothetical protein
VLDSSHENKTRFRVVITPQGNQEIQGFINSSVLSKNEQTQLLDQPVESFYHHFERPINKKI